jgi:hypothetical protein
VAQWVQVIPIAARHGHGLFLAGIELHHDRIAVRIFTSRPTQLRDLKERPKGSSIRASSRAD